MHVSVQPVALQPNALALLASQHNSMSPAAEQNHRTLEQLLLLLPQQLYILQDYRYTSKPKYMTCAGCVLPGRVRRPELLHCRAAGSSPDKGDSHRLWPTAVSLRPHLLQRVCCQLENLASWQR